MVAAMIEIRGPYMPPRWMRKLDQEPPSVAAELRRLRTERGLQSQFVADRMGVSASHYSQMEKGTRTPNATHRRRMTDFYGLPEGHLRRIEDAHDEWREANEQKLRDFPGPILMVVAEPAMEELLDAVRNREDDEIRQMVRTFRAGDAGDARRAADADPQERAG